MSIILYTGKPGAGKTYRVVHELLRDSGRYFVFHNIDGLRESMIEEGRYIQSWVDIPGFFTKAKQEEVCKWAREKYDRSVLVIVDEAQMIFGDRNAELKAWLSWHRHLGQDIKLICQHYKMILSDYYNLCDYEIRGKRGFMTSRLVYQWGVNGETFKTDRLPINKATFAAYRSFVGGEVNKGRSKMMLYAAGACALAVVMGVYVIGFGLPSVFAKAGGEKRSSISQQRQVASPVAKTPKKSAGVPPSDPFLDRLMSLSFAGVVGGRVLVQDCATLQIMPLSDVMEYKTVEVTGRSALVMTRDRGLMRLNVRSGRYAAAGKIRYEARATEPPAQARAAQ